MLHDFQQIGERFHSIDQVFRGNVSAADGVQRLTDQIGNQMRWLYG